MSAPKAIDVMKVWITPVRVEPMEEIAAVLDSLSTMASPDRWRQVRESVLAAFIVVEQALADEKARVAALGSIHDGMMAASTKEIDRLRAALSRIRPHVDGIVPQIIDAALAGKELP